LTHLGLALDNRVPDVSRTDWLMFSAATTNSTATRSAIVAELWNYASANLNNTPFDVAYDPVSAQASGGANSPAVGSMFSLLALEQSIQAINIPASLVNNPTSKHHGSAGAIAGGVVGGLVLIALIAAAIFSLLRHIRRQREEDDFLKAHAPDAYVEHFVEPVTVPTDILRTHHPYNEKVGLRPLSTIPVAADTKQSVRSHGVREEQRSGTSASDAGGNPSQRREVFPVDSVEQSPGGPPGTTAAQQLIVEVSLRSDMAELRREVERLMAERIGGVDELPPRYSSS